MTSPGISGSTLTGLPPPAAGGGWAGNGFLPRSPPPPARAAGTKRQPLKPPPTKKTHSALFFNDPAPTEIYPLSLHDALPISERFFARLAPPPVPAPRLIRLNDALARHLGIDPDRLAAPDGVEMLAGNRLPASISTPSGAASLSGSIPRCRARASFSRISRGAGTGGGASRAKNLSEIGRASCRERG